MQASQGEIDAVFRQLGRERLERWIALADERLAGTSVKWYVTGGNDDPTDVLAVLDDIESEHVVNCEEKVIYVDDKYPMANCGYSNPTPWDTPREVDEEVLEQHLNTPWTGSKDFESAIFQLPRSTLRLHADDCPKLDWTTDRRRRSSSPACLSPRRRAARPCERSSRSTSRSSCSQGTSTSRAASSRSDARP